MKIVGWHLVRLVAEAAHELVGGSVESTRREEATGRLLLILGSPRGRRYLVTGARTPGIAFHWTDDKDLLGSGADFRPTERLNRLRGARLTGMAIPGPDRLIETHWQKQSAGPDEGAVEYTLILDWTRGAGNIWLLERESRVILETWYPLTASQEDDRIPHNLLGARFQPAVTPGLPDWRSITFPDYERLREEHADVPLPTFLRRFLWGIDDNLASQAAMSAGDPRRHGSSPSAGERWNEFSAVMESLRAAVNPERALLLPEGDVQSDHLTVSARKSTPPSGAQIGSLAHLLTICDRHEQESTGDREALEALRQRVQRRGDQIRRRLRTAEDAVASEQQAKQLQHEADLLGAQRHLLRRGQSEVTISDFAADTPLTVPLDPALSPEENIAGCYRRARKLSHAAEGARREIPALQRAIAQWESLSRQLDSESPDPEALAAAHEALGAGASTTPRRKEAPARRLPYREFRIGEMCLWVGRSSRDNDELTLHHTRPEDVFFHAQGCPGSHVILKRAQRDKPVSQEMIVAAAQTAAFFSRAKHSGLVPVAYTEARHVRKPRKAPAGTVRLEQEQTLMVRPIPPPGYHDTRTSGE